MGVIESGRLGGSYRGETDSIQIDTEMGYRTESSQLTGNREEREDRGLVGSYLTTTRSYNPKTTLESIEGRELSLSPVPYRQDRTS